MNVLCFDIFYLQVFHVFSRIGQFHAQKVIATDNLSQRPFREHEPVLVLIQMERIVKTEHQLVFGFGPVGQLGFRLGRQLAIAPLTLNGGAIAQQHGDVLDFETHFDTFDDDHVFGFGERTEVRQTNVVLPMSVGQMQQLKSS